MAKIFLLPSLMDLDAEFSAWRFKGGEKLESFRALAGPLDILSPTLLQLFEFGFHCCCWLRLGDSVRSDYFRLKIGLHLAFRFFTPEQIQDVY